MTTVQRAFALIGVFAVAALVFAWLPGQAGAGQPEKPDAQARAPQIRELLEPGGAVPSASELPTLIRPDHPRLFMNQEMWPEMKARALGEANAEYREMQEIVQGLPPLEEIGTQDWGRQLAASAFVYRVTRDEERLAKIRRMLQKSVDFYDQVLAADTITNVNRGAVREAHLDYPFTRISWLAALDWVWNDLPPDERNTLSSRMIRHVHAFMERFAPHHHSWHGPFYYWDNMLWYTGLTLLGDHLSPEDYPLALEVLDKGYSDHLKMLARRARAGGDDGDFHAPQVEYAIAASAHAEWSFYHSWRAAMAAPIPEKWFAQSAIYPLGVFWNALPGYRHCGLARAWHKGNRIAGSTRFTKCLLGGYLAQHIYFYENSRPDLADLSHAMRRDTGLERCGKYGHIPLWSEIWSPVQPDPQARLPENLPLARHFEQSSIVFMRSGSGPDDTYALFNAGGGEVGSYQRDATHFIMYKQGFLALDSGTRGSFRPGDQHYEYAFRSVAHNCVLIDETGQTQDHNDLAEPLITAFESNPGFAYAASDATELYPEDKCAQMVRQFLFLPPNHFVVFDRVISTRAELEKKWLLHTANEPAVEGNAFRADQDRGRIFCRTVYPPDAQLVTIGGPGKEFWARGRNWPLSDEWWRRWGKKYDRQVPETMGRWRVEVRSGAAREQDHFLHLIQAADQSVEEMVESEVREPPGRVAVRFQVNGRTYTIALNKTGTVGGHIGIEQDGEMVVDRPLTQDIMPQAGLALMNE